MDRIYSDFGTPLSHKTDNGPQFNSEAFETFSSSNNIKHKRIPPLHPRSNEAECAMKPLGKAMKMAHHNRADKKQELTKFLRQYRATPHPSTGFPPGDVLFRCGYRAGHPKSDPPANIVDRARERDRVSKDKNYRYVNDKRFSRRREYVQGQLVLLRNDGRCRKFDPYYWKEPYIIQGKQGELLDLFRCSDGRSVQRHTSHVKPFVDRRSFSPAPLPACDNDSTLSGIEDETFVQQPVDFSAPGETPPLNSDIAPALSQAPPTQLSAPQPSEPRRSDRLRTNTRDTKYKDFVTWR